MARKLDVAEAMTKAGRNATWYPTGSNGSEVRARSSGASRRVERPAASGRLRGRGGAPRDGVAAPPSDGRGRWTTDVHDSESILGIDRAPESLLVLEEARWARVSSTSQRSECGVTVVDARSNLLPALDAEMAQVLAESSTGWGSAPHRGFGLGPGRRDGGLEAQARGWAVPSRPEGPGRLGAAPVHRRPRARGSRGRDRCERMGRVTGATRRPRPDVFAAGDGHRPPGLASIAMEPGACRGPVMRSGIGVQDGGGPLPPDLRLLDPGKPRGSGSRKRSAIRRARLRDRPLVVRTNAKARISGFPDGLVKLVSACPTSAVGVHIVGELVERADLSAFVMHGAARNTTLFSRRPSVTSRRGREAVTVPLRWADAHAGPRARTAIGRYTLRLLGIGGRAGRSAAAVTPAVA